MMREENINRQRNPTAPPKKRKKSHGHQLTDGQKLLVRSLSTRSELVISACLRAFCVRSTGFSCWHFLVQYLLSNRFYFPPMTNFSADYLRGSLSFWSLGTEWIYTAKCPAVLYDSTIIPIVMSK